VLIVTDIHGNAEALADVQNVEINEEINGDYSLSFTAFNSDKNAHSYPLLLEESIVDFGGHEFRVKRLAENRTQKAVEAHHVFFDLIDRQLYDYIGGTKSVDDIFAYLLTGSGWTFENVDVDNFELFSNFGEDNALSLIREACTVFNCELKIEPGRHIKIYRQVGADNDEQFRYKHNIKTLKKTVDTSKLATVIKGYGGNGLEVTYTSPNADIYGERHAEPVRDDRYTIAESMTERLKRELIDVPEISIELEVSALGFSAGLGDKVWMIYEPLNVEFQTRVMARKTYPFAKRSPAVTLSNKRAVLTDLLTETNIDIKTNQKETRSKIEQTNEKITLEVERIDESVAAIDVRADNIELSVTSLDGRMGNAESSISLNAQEIALKVSKDGVMSAIEQSAEAVKISANKIELTGITQVNGNLQIGTNLDSEKTITLNGSQVIRSNSDAMFLEAIRLDLNATYINFGAGSNVSGLYARFG
jgi:phage minor structural protein